MLVNHATIQQNHLQRENTSVGAIYYPSEMVTSIAITTSNRTWFKVCLYTLSTSVVNSGPVDATVTA